VRFVAGKQVWLMLDRHQAPPLVPVPILPLLLSSYVMLQLQAIMCVTFLGLWPDAIRFDLL
jgi:hypothetical protein